MTVMHSAAHLNNMQCQKIFIIFSKCPVQPPRDYGNNYAQNKIEVLTILHSLLVDIHWISRNLYGKENACQTLIHTLLTNSNLSPRPMRLSLINTYVLMNRLLLLDFNYNKLTCLDSTVFPQLFRVFVKLLQVKTHPH